MMTGNDDRDASPSGGGATADFVSVIEGLSARVGSPFRVVLQWKCLIEQEPARAFAHQRQTVLAQLLGGTNQGSTTSI
jgi:hypothetical protein